MENRNYIIMLTSSANHVTHFGFFGEGKTIIWMID